MADVELLVDGKRYGGWTEVEVKRSMEAVSGAFNIGLTERWAGQDRPWVILPGSECTLYIDGELVITGYVDALDTSFDANSHTIKVKGRDKTADMVDCSAVHKPDQWSNIKLDRLAEKLAAPFGVGVTVEADIGEAFTTVKLDHGETAWEALERHARQRAVMVMPDRRGGLIIAKPGGRRAGIGLTQGINVLSANGSIDFGNRFSDYIVKGQTIGTDDWDAEVSAHVSAETTDDRVKRYRPLLVQAEALQTGASAKKRAAWERNVRKGRSTRATVTVQGWQQTPGGELWEVNMLVKVYLPWLQINGEMMISSATYRKSSQGTLTELEITSPDAFQQDTTNDKPRKKKEDDDLEDWNSW